MTPLELVKRIFVSTTTIGTTWHTAGVQNGDLVEAIRLGGPRDGERVGFFRVRWMYVGNELDLQPVDASATSDGGGNRLL